MFRRNFNIVCDWETFGMALSKKLPKQWQILLSSNYSFLALLLNKQTNANKKNEFTEYHNISIPLRSQVDSKHGPVGMDASQMHLWDVSYSVSETPQRGLICKSLRRLPGDWLKMSPQRRLWDLSGFLRDVFELHLRDLFLASKLRHCSSKFLLK